MSAEQEIKFCVAVVCLGILGMWVASLPGCS